MGNRNEDTAGHKSIKSGLMTGVCIFNVFGCIEAMCHQGFVDKGAPIVLGMDDFVVKFLKGCVSQII